MSGPSSGKRGGTSCCRRRAPLGAAWSRTPSSAGVRSNGGLCSGTAARPRRLARAGRGEDRQAAAEADLPNDWDVVAGRDIPGGMGTVDLDLVVVGAARGVRVRGEGVGAPRRRRRGLLVRQRRSRHNPVSQVTHAAKVLAGRLKPKVPGWSHALKALPTGVRPVFAHVVLSHDSPGAGGHRRPRRARGAAARRHARPPSRSPRRRFPTAMAHTGLR